MKSIKQLFNNSAFAVLLMLLWMVGVAWAADTKLSALTELASAPAESDEYYINDGGTSKKITALNAAKLLESALTSYEIHEDNLPSTVTHTDEAETITGNWVNTDNPWADNEVVDTLSLAAWNLNKLTGAPGTPVAGEVYYADEANWDPAGLGIGKAYYVVYDGSNYIALFDEDGAWYLGDIDTTDPDSDDPDNWTISGYGHYIATGNSLTGNDAPPLPDATSGMNFCVSVYGAYTVELEPYSGDTIILDGAAETQDENVTSSGTAGDMICFEYYAANTWWATSDGWDGATD